MSCNANEPKFNAEELEAALREKLKESELFKYGIVERYEGINVQECLVTTDVWHEEKDGEIKRNCQKGSAVIQKRYIEAENANTKEEIVKKLAEKWSTEFANIIKSSIEGIFSREEMKESFNDLSGNVLDKDMMIYSLHNILGNKVKYIVCHPKVLDKLGSIPNPVYGEKRIIVNEAFTADENGAYPICFFGEGAFVYNENSELCKIEYECRKGTEVDRIVSRRAFVLHPRGFSWKGTDGAPPSDAGLAAPANWNLVTERKDVKIALLKARAK